MTMTSSEPETMFVVRFRVRGSVGPWWYLGAYEMGTTQKSNAILYPSLEMAKRAADLEAQERPGSEFKVEEVIMARF